MKIEISTEDALTIIKALSNYNVILSDSNAGNTRKLVFRQVKHNKELIKELKTLFIIKTI